MRKVFGYLRHDTIGELVIINDLYRGELRLYKNFFQPVMKLVSKERIGGRVKRKYDVPPESISEVDGIKPDPGGKQKGTRSHLPQSEPGSIEAEHRCQIGWALPNL